MDAIAPRPATKLAAKRFARRVYRREDLDIALLIIFELCHIGRH